jgi:N-acetylglutamate synthase-like GNAT family acetyltransferase
MTIRAAEEIDIPAIVALLKHSLGEGLMPKSEAYWRWKHVENPFGASPVLLAFENSRLVGVRAFMKWEWTDGQQVIKAVRAVDTATHPAFQGKGIFKKLTLDLVNSCQKQGVHFIFNTPNEQSRPGYLKMEWQNAGRMPVRFLIVNPLRNLFSSPVVKIAATDWLSQDKGVDSYIPTVRNVSLSTHYTTEYFKWRYGTVPVASYFVLQDSGNVIFYRFKENKWGKELRVTDWLGIAKGSRTIQSQLHRIAAKEGARSITLSGLLIGVQGGIVLSRGPRVTVRNLNYERFAALDNFKSWSPSLGDMELF